MAILVGELHGVPELPRHYVVRESDVAALREQLIGQIGTTQTSEIKGIEIHGMGGIGKSLMAVALARDIAVRHRFSAGVYWLRFGREPNIRQNWIRLRDWLGGGRTQFRDVLEASSLLKKITNTQACLVILDDVWESEHITAFRHLGDRCCLLVTSRNANVLDEINAYHHELNLLSDVEARQLLARVTGMPVENWHYAAETILKAGSNLPLALAMIGSALPSGLQGDWSEAVQALREESLGEVAGKLPEYPNHGLFAAIEFSVRALHSGLRECYYDFAVFPNNVLIPQAVLLTFWKPLSRPLAKKYLDDLVHRNLLERDATGCVIVHDLQMAFIREQVQDLPARHERLLNNYNASRSSWHTIRNDGYLYDYLAHHLYCAGAHDELFHLLTSSPDWMEAKFAELGADQSYANDLELALRHYSENSRENIRRTIALWAARQAVNARVTSFSDRTLTAMALIGKQSGNATLIQYALNIVRLRADPKSRFAGLCQLHKVLGSSSDAMDEVLDATQAVEDCWRQSALVREIPSGYAQTDQFEEELAIARNSRNDVELVRILCSIAELQMERGFQDAAKSTMDVVLVIVEKTDDDKQRAIALITVGETQLQLGLLDAARSTIDSAFGIVEKINDHVSRVEALARIARVQAQDGQAQVAQRAIDAAFGIVEKINDHMSRVEALARIARVQAQDGQAQAAQSTIDTVAEIVKKIESDEQKLRERISKVGERVPDGQDGSDSTIGEQMWKSIRWLVLSSSTSWTSAIVKRIEDIRADVLRDIAKEQAQAGQFATALAVAKKIENLERYTSALAEITEVLAQVKQFAMALATAEEIEDSEQRGRALSRVAGAQAQGRRFTAALATAREIRNDRWRAEALARIAEAQAKASQFTEALEIAEELKQDLCYTDVLVKIAVMQAQAGQYDMALVTVEKIEEDWQRVQALSGISESHAQAGQLQHAQKILDMALTTIGKTDKSVPYVLALVAVAKALMHAGDLTSAEAITETIEDPWLSDWILEEISKTQMQTGAIDAALKVAAKITDERRRALAFLEGAVIEAQSGDPIALQLIADRIEDGQQRSMVFSRIAKAQVRLERFDVALMVAEVIEDDLALVQSYSEIALAQSRAGFIEAAKGVFAAALAIARNIDDLECRADALGSIATAYVQLDEIYTALDIAETSGKECRAKILKEIAIAQAKCERFHGSLMVADMIADVKSRSKALADIAIAQARAGHLDAALATNEKISDTWQRAVNLGGIAVAEGNIEWLDAALTIIRQAEDDWRRATALSEIAAAQAQAGIWCGSYGALCICDARDISEFVRFIAEQWEQLERVEEGLAQRALWEVLRIAGWMRMSWRSVYAHATS